MVKYIITTLPQQLYSSHPAAAGKTENTLNLDHQYLE